ncbi:MAG: hypothetical protein QOF76_1616 [Solirubrobacteraceae bacterium]|jgi:very-short-patch-repair endonuclease|nr:hypothetical protein [Solirubrobacteraceae bacterium]
MDETLDRRLRAQHECVGAWQLSAAGWKDHQVQGRLRAGGLRQVDGMDGVWTSVRGRLSPTQRRSAATRTAPGTALALHSGARHRAVMEDRDREPYITVVRRGMGGPRRIGDLLVYRTPRPIFAPVDGIPTVDVSRTLVDLVPHLNDDQLRRAVIEGLRLHRTTISMLRHELPRRKGAPRLRRLLDDLEHLPIARCRSNAEGQALWRLQQQDRTVPDVNVYVAGHLVDQVDHATREVTEIDGGAFHADTDKDAARDADVNAIGYTVRRRPSDDAYDTEARW